MAPLRRRPKQLDAEPRLFETGGRGGAGGLVLAGDRRGRQGKVARAQLHAAEVAHHRCQHALEVLVAQHFQHRPARGAARFTVVVGGGLPAGQQGPADMGGARVLGPQPRHHGKRRCAVGHRLHAAQEAALADHEFAVDGMRERQGHAASLAEQGRPTGRGAGV